MTIRVVNVRGLRGEARAGVVYVGRAFAGWGGDKLANPFRLDSTRVDLLQARNDVLDRYHAWLMARPTLEADLAQLWEDIEHGAKPLGCWCCDWEIRPHSGSGPIMCHAQILALELMKRFGKAAA